MSEKLQTYFEEDIDDFQTYLQNRGYTLRTQNEYVREVIAFLDYVKAPTASVTKGDIMRFQKVMRDRGAGDGAINRMISSIRCFYKALIEFEKIQVNPAITVPKSKVEKNRSPVFLSEEELADFLEYVDGRHKIRNLAICLLMAYGGLRVSEVHALNIEHFQSGENPTLHFMGKGRKWRTVPLHESVAVILETYLQERVNPKDGDSSAFFISQEGRRIGRRTIQSIIDRATSIIKQARPTLKDKKISSHKLRHTFATNHFRSGTDLRTLQELLGHSDISTTQIYTHVDTQQLAAAQSRIRPRIPANY
ncbi:MULTISPECIES: tyrosine-type recombinase/integrase [unclassified Paenibacillus]|uniref:tyrosine-type recombinase/integrase n=1 Tax=unclassified Paenibacillus TaxID=185978 RepID=UPI00277D4FCE|nr:MULTISPECIES: tyrosine-type recombinase/integrase [unclassified Paenibacillus]MDQ0896331.1 integrase/recombinase XerD [Paenibacillus sp. V4I7]MDQ0913743.1 integrase/recombinase XerD [Paenibacillus sp. V4I5]